MSHRQERARQRLKASILEELRKQDALKRDVLAELNRRRSFAQVLQHPAALLVLGFLFTSVLGARFSAYWQSQEWHRQQALQTRQRALEQKYQIANEVAQAVGEIYAASAGVLSSVHIDNVRKRQQEVEEKRKPWLEARQQWLAKSSTLLQRLTTHFAVDPQASSDNPTDVRTMFIHIYDQIHITNVHIANTLGQLESNGWDKKKFIEPGGRCVENRLEALEGEGKLSRSEVLEQSKQITTEAETMCIVEDELNQMRDVETEKLMRMIARELRDEANPLQ
jgi:hypothetical protein